MVVVLTKEREIVEVGLAAVAFPPPHVVGIDEGRVPTTGEAAMSVSAPEFATLGWGRISARPTLVDRVAHVVVEGHHHGGITGETPGDHRVDQAPVLELTGELAVLAERGERHVGDDEVGARGDLGA